jgi:hypothetical protein
MLSMKRPPRVVGAALLAALAAVGCTGTIGGDPGGETGGPGPSPTGSSPDRPSGSPAANAPGPAPLRRLSIREYNRTVRDLLGLGAVPPTDFGIDQDAGGFSVGAPVSTAVDAARLLEAADQLAAGAAARLAGLLPCAPAISDPAAQETCARQFLIQFGRRAFRRPLGPDEVNDLLAVYRSHRAPELGYLFADAIQAVVSAMLVSPQFLYHLELGAQAPVKEGGIIRFNAHEMASRLSYGLWGSMPDESLFKEADAGRLATPDQIEQQARRMLADPRAAEAIADFHLQWLDVDGLPAAPPKDPRFKDYTPALARAMLDETVSFATAAVLGGRGGLEKLLTGTSISLDPALARLYGAPDPTQRAGVLTQASFLAMHADSGESNPVRRGAAVSRRLLCTEVEPPANMDIPQPQAPAPGLTTRERFAMHALNPCATCHQVTDPLGFAFESYDAVGAYRTTDQGKPVDASGSIRLASGELKFKNAVELARGLAQAKEVQDCLATQWLRYLLRRTERGGDQASLQAVSEVFRRSGYDLRELLVALVKTRAFTHRAPSPGEVSP